MKPRTTFAIIFMLVLAWASTILYYQQVIGIFQGAQEDLPFYVGAPQPNAYTFDTNSTHYFAYNGTTGLVSSGTNISQLVNDAISVSEGEFHFRVGDYTFDAPILLHNKTILSGEGFDTQLLSGDGLDDALIQLANNKTYGTVIKNLLINGNYAGQTSSDAHGVYYNNVDFLNPVSGNAHLHKIESVMIRECRGDGFKVSGTCRELTMLFVNAYDNNGTGFNLATTYSTDGKWKGCVAGSNDEYGFSIQSGCNQFSNCKSFGNGNDGVFISGWYNLFESGVVQENARHGIQLRGSGAYQNQVVGNLIDSNDNTGILLNGTGAVNRIESNTIADIRETKLQTGICIYNTNYAIVMNNEVNYNLYRINITGASLYTQFFHNYGFCTENGGFVNATSPITVAHGLVDYAGWVVLAPYGDTPNIMISWANVNATHFNIYHNATDYAGVSWQAYCQPTNIGQ